MDSLDVERKLAAILSADVQGYSRLMGQDEVATVATLTEYRLVMAELIAAHHGRVVDAPGDNMLAEFGSVVDAVECAVEIQRALEQRNAELSDERKMIFRIGINLGDVIVDGESIFGDGVNIAARLEGLAPPGGIAVSGSVYDQIRNKISLKFAYQGRHQVKNIDRPVRVYIPQLGDSPSDKHPFLWHLTLRHRSRRTRWVTTIILAVLILGGAWLGWVKNSDRHRQAEGRLKEAIKIAHQAMTLPDKPSIAVLPFTNMSGQADQEYFSDGITEDIITDLSRVSGLFVISRNSVFAYKNKTVKIEQIGRDLGVRYVLEGSVRRAGNKVRITAQLIDATTGYHVWADRFDRDLTDIFAIQDEVTARIVGALEVKLAPGEKTDRQAVKVNAEAYDLILQARRLVESKFTEQANLKARRLISRAIDLDQNFAPAWTSMGWTYFREWSIGWTNDPGTLDRAAFFADKALAIDADDHKALNLLGWVNLWRKQFDRAMMLVRKSIAINPNQAESYAALGEIMIWAGQPHQAIKEINKAIRLNPMAEKYYACSLGHAYLLLGRYDQTIAIEERAIKGNPDNMPAYFALAVAYVKTGQLKKAAGAMRELARMAPTYSLEVARSRLPYKDPAVLEMIIQALTKAHRAAEE